jgi:hypothetical protein
MVVILCLNGNVCKVVRLAESRDFTLVAICSVILATPTTSRNVMALIHLFICVSRMVMNVGSGVIVKY